MGLSTEIFGLLVASALTHATWNLAARKIKGNMGVVWVSLSAASIVMVPIASFFLFAVPSVLDSHFSMASLPSVIATGILHTFYYILLSLAYKHGEISVVYPIARGTGVVITAIIASLVLHEVISPLAWAGIGATVLGVILIGLGGHITEWLGGLGVNCSLWNAKKTTDVELQLVAVAPVGKSPPVVPLEMEPQVAIAEELDAGKVSERAAKRDRYLFLVSIGLAIAVGACIAMYSIADKLGVGLGVDPITYVTLLFGQTSLFMAPYILLRHRSEVKEAVSSNKKYVAIVGPMSVIGYLAILFAYQHSDASYVVAVREVSVLFGSVLGFLVLKEQVTIPKMAGIVVITAGLVLLKLAP